MLFRYFKKKGDQARINTDGWMMSYADMATTLLATSIVLSTLGRDQTGISLYNGTGSFVESMHSFGLPGVTPNSSRLIPLEASSPHYPVGSSEGNAAPDGQLDGSAKPDGQDPSRLIDGEEAQLQQFLDELNRLFRVDKLPRSTGRAAVDLYERFNKTAPLLRPRHLEVLGQVLPALHRSNYRVLIVVWATTPGERAWLRAAHQAQQATDEIAAAGQLDAAARPADGRGPALALSRYSPAGNLVCHHTHRTTRRP